MHVCVCVCVCVNGKIYVFLEQISINLIYLTRYPSRRSRRDVPALLEMPWAVMMAWKKYVGKRTNHTPRRPWGPFLGPA